jgi:hypothetical protein
MKRTFHKSEHTGFGLDNMLLCMLENLGGYKERYAWDDQSRDEKTKIHIKLEIGLLDLEE